MKWFRKCWQNSEYTLWSYNLVEPWLTVNLKCPLHNLSFNSPIAVFLKPWVASDKCILLLDVSNHMCAPPRVWTGGPFICYGYKVTLNVALPINLPVPILIPQANIFYTMDSFLPFLEILLHIHLSINSGFGSARFESLTDLPYMESMLAQATIIFPLGTYSKLLWFLSFAYVFSLLKTLPLWDQSRVPRAAVMHIPPTSPILQAPQPPFPCFRPMAS